MKAAMPLGDLLEKDWQRQVNSLAQQLGWNRVYHTYRSTRSDPGFPDLVLVRDRVVFLELKREAGRLSAAQREWLAALLDAGAEAYVARPRDLQLLAEILASRGQCPARILLRAQTLDETIKEAA